MLPSRIARPALSTATTMARIPATSPALISTRRRPFADVPPTTTTARNPKAPRVDHRSFYEKYQAYLYLGAAAASLWAIIATRPTQPNSPPVGSAEDTMGGGKMTPPPRGQEQHPGK